MGFGNWGQGQRFGEEKDPHRNPRFNHGLGGRLPSSSESRISCKVVAYAVFEYLPSIIIVDQGLPKEAVLAFLHDSVLCLYELVVVQQ